MFGFLRRSSRTYSLEEAATAARDCARRERLPLSYVAERGGDSVSWFANSIASAAAKTGTAQGITARELKSYLEWLRSVR